MGYVMSTQNLKIHVFVYLKVAVFYLKSINN